MIERIIDRLFDEIYLVFHPQERRIRKILREVMKTAQKIQDKGLEPTFKEMLGRRIKDDKDEKEDNKCE